MIGENRTAILRTILTGIDGTPESAAARELGVRWAAKFEAMALGLGVVDEDRLLEEEAASLPGAGHHWHAGGGDTRAAAHKRIKEALREFQARCADVGVRCHTHDDVGGPSERILACSRRADLVVLGRRVGVEPGRGALEAILRDCPRPVVAVPSEPTGGEAAVVAYDGSPQASRAIYAFIASGLGQGRPVHVVAVDRSEAEATHRAGSAADYLKSHDMEAHPCPVTTGLAPALAILDRSQELDAGLIVMGAYGESALREFFLGSTTRSILSEARAAVFCFH